MQVIILKYVQVLCITVFFSNNINCDKLLLHNEQEDQQLYRIGSCAAACLAGENTTKSLESCYKLCSEAALEQEPQLVQNTELAFQIKLICRDSTSLVIKIQPVPVSGKAATSMSQHDLRKFNGIPSQMNSIPQHQTKVTDRISQNRVGLPKTRRSIAGSVPFMNISNNGALGGVNSVNSLDHNVLHRNDNDFVRRKPLAAHVHRIYLIKVQESGKELGDRIVYMSESRGVLAKTVSLDDVINASRRNHTNNRMIEYTERYFRGLDLWSLGVDEAFINASVLGVRNYYLYSLSEECDKCPYTRIHEISSTSDKNNVFKLDISRKVNLKVFERNLGKYAYDNESFACQFSEDLGEFGVYDLSVEDGYRPTCALSTAKEPVNIYLPLITIALTTIILFMVIKYGIRFVQRFHQTEPLHVDPGSPASSQASGPPKTRLRSLDTFRGIAITIMIFANSGGGHYWWFEHATWNGLHVADLVFPWFLFIMGVCIPISLRSQLSKNIPRKEILTNIAIRSLKLFCIGLCLNSINGPKIADLRLFGVLQRFAVAYFIVSIIHLYCYQDNGQLQHPIAKSHIDIIRLWKHWVVVGGIMLVYLLVMFFVPVPGCPSGYFGPGGTHLMRLYPNCTGGITGYIDRILLGNSHLYQHPTARYTYDAIAFDPEGPFGCLPTILQVFLGLQCGVLILTHSEVTARVRRLTMWGIVLGLLGGILCSFSKNNGWLPVNKNLWSLSYVLVTASLAYFLLLICFILIDVKNMWNGNPFLYAGMNAIILYVGHTVFHKMLPWHWKIGRMNTHFMLTLEALWNTVLWNIIAYFLYKKKIFYSV